MSETPIRLLCILGPTAAGKTRLAALVANELDGEVISADSRQVYRQMDLGTGKDLADYEVDGRSVPYHLIDIADPGTEYNVYEYKRDCAQAIREVDSRGKLPVLCGGTGLYLSAILQDYELRSAPPDPARRAELDSMPTEQLIATLSSRVALHNTTDTSDRLRLIRAIEIAEAGPQSPVPSVPIDASIFGLRWEPGLLRERIVNRLEQRLGLGLMDEVRALLDGGLSAARLKSYGLEYRYITEYLSGETNRERMAHELARAIQKFAKRQRTWFRRMERQGVSIHWLDGQLTPSEQLRQIQRQVAAG